MRLDKWRDESVGLMQYTMEELKEVLPDVKVRYKGNEYIGVLRGRKNEWGTVIILELDLALTWSWEMVLTAINKGYRLNMG